MAQELLIHWLNNAYAISQAQIKLLEACSADFERYPDIRSELRQHLLETRSQLDDIKECLDMLGARVSPANTDSVTIMPGADGRTVSNGDRLMQDLVLLHAREHLEHGTYLALAEAARQSGEDEIADICERIAEEEAAMAEWIEEQIPAVVTIGLAAARDEA